MRTYVIEEPDQADTEETKSVELEDKAVRSLLLHGLLLVLLGLLESETKNKKHDRKDRSNT